MGIEKMILLISVKKVLIEGVSVSFQDFGEKLRENEAENEEELIEKIK